MGLLTARFTLTSQSSESDIESYKYISLLLSAGLVSTPTAHRSTASASIGSVSVCTERCSPTAVCKAAAQRPDGAVLKHSLRGV